MKIGIKIDDKDSKIWFNHFERLPDTVHIQTWTLFHNLMPDTIGSVTLFFHCANDSSIVKYKDEKKVYVSNHNAIKPGSFKFKLNKKVYKVVMKVQEEKGKTINWLHNYPTKEDKKKAEAMTWKTDGKMVQFDKTSIGIRSIKSRFYVGVVNF